MKLAGRIELKIIELPDALEVTCVREYGWFELAVGLTITVLALWLFWRVNTLITHFVVAAISAVIVASIIAHRVQGNSSKLRVTNDEVLAEGNLDKLFTTKLRVPFAEIELIEYRLADEGASGGIYVKHHGSRTCVLPGLDEEHGESVVNGIFEKFPTLRPEDNSPTSFLYGNESGVTRLGISDSESAEKNSKP